MAVAERTLAKAFPGATSVRALQHDSVGFVDAGQLFETVRCPACRAELSMGWWGEAMDAAAAGPFQERAVITPCCGWLTSLERLDYHWPQGFASFVLEATNPGTADLPEGLLQTLERALGCELRVVWARL